MQVCEASQWTDCILTLLNTLYCRVNQVTVKHVPGGGGGGGEGGQIGGIVVLNIIIMSLYSQRPRPKHTGLTLDLLSRGNSDQNELREVVAGAVSNQRVENFRFRDSFEEGWWRVILAGQVDVAHPLPQPPGCRADTEIVCPGSTHRICNVQRCDGEEDCPRLPGQEKSWDETEGRIFSSSSRYFDVLCLTFPFNT